MKLLNPTLSQSVEVAVAERYTVSAVDAQKSFEEFAEGADSPTVRFKAHSFGFIAPLRGDLDAVEARLASALRVALLTAWPDGAQVMWRRRPEFDHDPLGRLVRCRLAATTPPPDGHVGFSPEGFPYASLRDDE